MKLLPYYTHAGFFHADEVTGYAICALANVCDGYDRLTDLSNIPSDGIVADIGREWSPSDNRFDHHQGLFRRNEETGAPFASAGMLWDYFGAQAISNVIPLADNVNIYDIMMRVDETLIQGIDAHDADGAYKFEATCSAGPVRVLTVSNVVSAMNSEDVNNHEIQHLRFGLAADLMKELIESHIRAAWQFIQAKEKFSQLAEVHGQVIVLSEGLPWKEIVHEQHPGALFVISPSNHPGNPWSMIAVPVEPESREVKCRIERPEWFDGFIHQGKWIAAANSVTELERLANYNISLEEQKQIDSELKTN